MAKPQVVVKEVGNIRVLIDTHKGMAIGWHFGQLDSFVLSHLVVCVDPTSTNDQDVTVLKLGSLGHSASFEVFGRNRMARVHIVRLLSIAPVIKKDTSSDFIGLSNLLSDRLLSWKHTNTMGGPGLYSAFGGLLDLLRCRLGDRISAKLRVSVSRKITHVVVKHPTSFMGYTDLSGHYCQLMQSLL